MTVADSHQFRATRGLATARNGADDSTPVGSTTWLDRTLKQQGLDAEARMTTTEN